VATPEDILRLRDYIAEPDDTNGWTDARLAAYVDANTNLFNAAAEIWGVKAGTYAGLVNVSESGSSRSLGDLLSQAQKMGKYYSDLGKAADNEVLIPSGPVIRRITRQQP
jgi:hypothetical protein